MRRVVLGLLALAGCSSNTGVVEVAWAFVDRGGEQIFPGGLFAPQSKNACGLPGRTSNGQLSYDVSVELRICDPECSGGCEDDACQVVSPLAFGCSTSRGSDPDIPSSGQPYQFLLQPILELSDGSVCRDPDPTCVAAPGPRQRRVKPGLVTDLQVYQFVLNFDLDAPSAEQSSLDLEACGCV